MASSTQFELIRLQRHGTPKYRDSVLEFRDIELAELQRLLGAHSGHMPAGGSMSPLRQVGFDGGAITTYVCALARERSSAPALGTQP